MGQVTGIEWCHATFNPWRGCTKISPGCTNCYAETMSHRNPHTLGIWGPKGARTVAAESYWREPLKWDRAASAAGERRRVFCASLADWLEPWEGRIKNTDGCDMWVSDAYGLWEHDNGTPGFAYHRRPLTMDEMRARLLKTIHLTPSLDWLLLTKRPEHFGARMQAVAMLQGSRWPDIADGADLAGQWLHGACMPNIWLGVSVEDQQRANERIPQLLKVPAAVRFLSCEPLLGAVDLRERFADGSYRNYLTGQFHGLKCKGLDGHPDFVVDTQEPTLPCVDWVIVGGESGADARPMHPEWVRGLHSQCRAAGVPYFFKQWGEWLPYEQAKWIPEYRQGFHYSVKVCRLDEDKLAARVGKKDAGRLLDGKEWNEFPEAKNASR